MTSLDTIFKTVGIPKRILTDNATNYRSKRVQRYLSNLRVSRSFTSSFHPQTNGTNEKVNGTIVNGLRLEMTANPRLKWSTLLQKVVQNYNNTLHTTTGFTPTFLLYGTDRLKTSSPPLTEARAQAVERSDRFKSQKKTEYDRKHKPLDLSVGDIVKRRVPIR